MRTKAELAILIEQRVPECDELARGGNVQGALDILHSLEKESRVINDASANKQILVKVVELCVDTRRWDKLCEEIVLMSKRKGLLMQAFVTMIEMCCKLVAQTPNRQLQLSLIQALRQASTGKMQVELHRARLTKRLAMIKEEEGDIASAADILQELHIENTGLMEPKEKVDFVLEQMRLCLANKDFLKASIVSRRVGMRFFEDGKQHELESRYLHLMVKLDLHDRSYYKVCRHYLRLYEVYNRTAELDKSVEMLRFAILFIVLSPIDPEQQDLIQRIKQTHAKSINSPSVDPIYEQLLRKFTGKELISWSTLSVEVESSLRSTDSGGKIVHQDGLFAPETEDGDKRWEDFELRVIEFNIRVIATFYSEIRITRMAELLELQSARLERVLCELIVSKQVMAKVDRLDGIVSFISKQRKDPIDAMNEMVSKWSELMHMMEVSVHLINREEMANATRVTSS